MKLSFATAMNLRNWAQFIYSNSAETVRFNNAGFIYETKAGQKS